MRSKLEKDRPTSTMESLPREIVLDILSRLPITSLLPCKFVCRYWRNLTEDPLLVDMHFSRTDENDKCLILHSDYPMRNQLYSVDLSAHGNEAVKKLQVPTMPEFNVVGSCNGFLCLCDSSDSSALYIYNPFTKNCIDLPKPTDYPNQNVVFGFGFHAITKEYKVVRAVYYRDNTQGRFPCRRFSLPKSEVQIFTLRSPTWRTVGNISHRFFQCSPQVLVNGKLHWVTWAPRYGPGRKIVSFDLADEQFRELSKPDCGDLDRCNYHLVVLGGCLSAAVYGDYGQFEIWVMKEYDVKESWVKEFSIGIHVPQGLEQDVDRSFSVSKFYCDSSFVRVLGLLKNGEILLEYFCRALVSYDPKCGTFKHHVFPGTPYLFESVVHVGSLKWIDTLIDM